MQLLFSFDQDMRVDETLVQLLFSFDPLEITLEFRTGHIQEYKRYYLCMTYNTSLLNQKVPKAGDQTPSEEGEMETKDSLMSSKAKKSGKRQSMSEGEVSLFKKRMRDMYVAVQKYQVRIS